MSLHVSNATTQHYVFFYREVVANAPHPLLRSIEINSGCQAVIECAPDQKAGIIKQLEAAGAHDAAETHRKIKDFHGLIYRDVGQISEDEIVMGHDSVKAMQNDRSVEQVTNSALAADRALNPDRRHRQTRVTEVEIEQVPAPGQRMTGNEARFSLAVDADGGSKKLVKTARAA
jgi:hypothetical protein